MRAAIAERIESARARYPHHVGDPYHPFPSLTKSQQRLVTELCENKASRKEIAHSLGYTYKSVGVRLSEIFHSLGCNMDERALVITYWKIKSGPSPAPVAMEDFYQ